MDSQGLRRRDTTKGPPLRILSLDGGGVRGYSMFILLQQIMHQTFVEIEGRAPRRHEIPKPCDHFDLIVGTGTGGLIALMLGRLRLDLETCKELYVRLTRMVFETDKTIAGIPYRSTLFKATKLEEAIKEAVREHTVNETEGNDGSTIFSPLSPVSRSSAARPRRHSSNASVISFSSRSPQSQNTRPPPYTWRLGDPEARLYDEREYRTKTAVTAIYKGTPKGGAPALLRSYDSRREPAPEFDCKIWEAGRATCAIGLAFKPIQIGQSVFHDDGAGDFNPSMIALDEAVVNEWPGREVGVFISLGTGKRPRGSDANSALWYEGFLGEFAEARRKLIAKIEGCEKIHEKMKKEHLARRGVNPENYYRFNVEVGVGEFGMNEWNRLADISTNTKHYLSRDEENRMVQSAAAKLAKIHFARLRRERAENATVPASAPNAVQPYVPVSDIEIPMIAELPGDFPTIAPPRPSTPPSRQSFDSGTDSLPVRTHTPSPRTSAERPQQSPNLSAQPFQLAAPPPPSSMPMPGSPSQAPPTRPPKQVGPGVPGLPSSDDSDRLVVNAPTPSQYRLASSVEKITVVGPDDWPYWPQEPPAQAPPFLEPPPRPPKTPLPEHQQGPGRKMTAPVPAPAPLPPYPLDDDEQPPPMVNMARKPRSLQTVFYHRNKKHQRSQSWRDGWLDNRLPVWMDGGGGHG